MTTNSTALLLFTTTDLQRLARTSSPGFASIADTLKLAPVFSSTAASGRPRHLWSAASRDAIVSYREAKDAEQAEAELKRAAAATVAAADTPLNMALGLPPSGYAELIQRLSALEGAVATIKTLNEHVYVRAERQHFDVMAAVAALMASSEQLLASWEIDTPSGSLKATDD